ncbi:MAG: DUF3089 domain-containing protein [Novosphingobium sp.]
MARTFLYLVAGLIVLVLAGLLALRFFADALTSIAFVPRAAFTRPTPLAASIYDDPGMWFARPGLRNDPVRWLPEGARRGGPNGAAVFFIHPTSYLSRDRWNAPLDDAVSRWRAELFVRGMASPFGDAAEVWAPRYRQAAIGAFLTDRPEANQAVDLAYGDVLEAFDTFIAHEPKDRPIVLAGHSQGALHLIRLLRDRVAGKPLADRIAAAYAIGWAVSPQHDLPAMGLPACNAPDQAGCVMSWQSFAEPASPPEVRAGFPAARALDGKRRLDAPPLCTNPLTGGAGANAPASADLGTLIPNLTFTSGKLVPKAVAARCDARGLLLIEGGPERGPPDMGPFVLPGNNYHVYDIPLFWANLRADADRRIAAWRAQAERAPR